MASSGPSNIQSLQIIKMEFEKKENTYILISDASLQWVQKSVSTDKQREHVGRRNNFAYLLNSFSRLISYTQILVQDKNEMHSHDKTNKIVNKKTKKVAYTYQFVFSDWLL